MRVRPNTWDARIVENVLVRNEYGLPQDLRGAVIVDIGAHIGAFAVACQKRNAATVYCFEPDPENFKLLVHNIQQEKDSQTEVRLCDAAVYNLDTKNSHGIRRLTEHDFDGGRNTGHVDIFGVPDGTETIGINTILKDIHHVDLLKIDCEGSEWVIFESITAENLAKIHAIAGELHRIPAGSAESFQSLTDNLIRKLRKAGFETNVIYESPDTARLHAARQTVNAEPETQKPVQVQEHPKLLWLGDAGVYTGFGKVTENVCARLAGMGWDVRVLGVGYNGDPHRYPFRIYPAVDPNTGGDHMGLTRLPDLLKRIGPDIMVIQDDSWNVGLAVDRMAILNLWIPTVGYVAVDSENVRNDVAVQLRNLKHAICHTQFGADQLVKAGYSGPVSVAGHGVDESFAVYSKKEAREGIPFKQGKVEDAFIFGVVAANQARKRLDLTMQYFATWWNLAEQPSNAYLYIHTNSDGTWDMRQLADHLGIRGRLLTSQGSSLPADQMPALYNAFDVLISTSEGESFGLPHLEAAACGIPQIAVDCGGLPSWAGSSIYYVEPAVPHFLEGRINAKRWVARESDFVAAMMDMYRDESLRKEYSRRGLELAKQFTWDETAKHFNGVLRQVLDIQKRARQSDEDCLAEFA